MCYLLVKDTNKHGCTALKSKPGKELSELKIELEDIVKGKGIQVVMISRPIAYGEYAPYSFVNTSDELIEVAKGM